MMKITSMARLAFFGIWGILLGCAPTGSAVSDTQVNGQRQGNADPSAGGSRSQSDYAQTVRSGSGGQSISRSAPRPSSDRPTAASAANSLPGDTEVLDAEWTMTIEPDATVLIQHKGVPIVSAKHVTWAEKTREAPSGRWVGSKFKAEQVRDGRGTISGTIAELKLQATGAIQPIAQNELRFDYVFRADQGHDGIYGATLDWKLDLQSRTFDRKVSNPVLFDDKTGWNWPVGPNQAITVRFDRPLDDIFFEANKKNSIRAFFYAERINRGERAVGFTVRLPDGGRIAPTVEERYGSSDRKGWFRDALSWDSSPIDLSFLNAQDRPAGRHGLLRANGDQFLFEDGTPVRFWGANLAAYALFSTPRENIRQQAHRMAQLGYNLMRIVLHDSDWCRPNIFLGDGKADTRHLNPQSLELLDWWIKCLKDEGIYIWLDMVYDRALVAGGRCDHRPERDIEQEEARQQDEARRCVRQCLRIQLFQS